MGLIGLVFRLISLPFRLLSSLASDRPNTQPNTQPSTQLVDPAASRSAHGPEASGLPMDPFTAAGRTYLTLYAVGFVCAFDYVAHLMSSQLCWLVLGGPRHLYGLTVGIYDICLIVAAPAFGTVSDRLGYKWPLFVGILCTTLGNLLYGFLFLINHTTIASDGRISTTGWRYMIVARCIMGFGAAASSSGTAYVTSRTTSKQRLASLGSYRQAQTYARMLGPLIGFAFIHLPVAVSNDDPVSEKLFNFFTMPAWVAVGLGSIVCLLVLFLFDDEAIAPVDTAQAHQPCELSQSYPLPRLAALPLATQLAFGTAYWSVYTQLTGFSIASFQVVQTQADLWKPYIGVAVGSLVGGFLWRKVRSGAATAAPTAGDISKVGCCAGMLICIVGFPLLISYGGQSQTAPEWQMYAAAGCFGFGAILYFSNVRAEESRPPQTSSGWQCQNPLIAVMPVSLPILSS